MENLFELFRFYDWALTELEGLDMRRAADRAWLRGLGAVAARLVLRAGARLKPDQSSLPKNENPSTDTIA